MLSTLEGENIELKTNDNEYLLDIKDEIGFESFVYTLSEYIVLVNYSNLVKKSLKKKDEKEVIEIIKRQMENLYSSDYFRINTSILLKEHFKRNFNINLESFYLFNMKGFKEEVKNIIENVNYSMEYDNFLDTQVFGSENYEELDLEGEPSDIFSFIKERAVDEGLDIESIKEINVYGDKKRLYFKDNKKQKLDYEYFIIKLGIMLDFDFGMKISNEEADTLKDIMLFTCIISIFNIKKVIIHKSVDESSKDLLLYNIDIYKLEDENNYEIIDCKGCEDCE